MTTLNYLELPQTPYIPRAPQLSEQLLANTADTYEKQSQATFGEMDAMDELALNTQAKLSGLGETDKAKLAEIQNVTQAQMSEYVDKYGARGALRYVKQAARGFKEQALPFVEASTTVQGLKSRIQASKADQKAKNIAMSVISQDIGDSMFDENGNVKKLTSSYVADILDNYKDYTTFIDDTVKKMKDVSTETPFSTGIVPKDSSGNELVDQAVYVRVSQSGISKDRMQTLATSRLLSDPQMRSQLELEGKYLQNAGGFTDNEGKPLFDTSVENFLTTEQVITSASGKEVSMSPVEYLAATKVIPNLEMVGLSTKYADVRTPYLDRLLSDKKQSQTIFSKRAMQYGMNLEAKGYKNSSDFYKTRASELREYETSLTALDSEIEEIVKVVGDKDVIDRNKTTSRMSLKKETNIPLLKEKIVEYNRLQQDRSNTEGAIRLVEDYAETQLRSYIEQYNRTVSDADKLPIDFTIESGEVKSELGKKNNILPNAFVPISVQAQSYGNKLAVKLQNKFEEFSNQAIEQIKPAENMYVTASYIDSKSDVAEEIDSFTGTTLLRSGTVKDSNGTLLKEKDIANFETIGIPRFVLRGRDKRPTLILDLQNKEGEIKNVEFTGRYVDDVTSQFASGDSYIDHVSQSLYNYIGSDKAGGSKTLTEEVLEELGIANKEALKDYKVIKNISLTNSKKNGYTLYNPQGDVVAYENNFDKFFTILSQRLINSENINGTKSPN